MTEVPTTEFCLSFTAGMKARMDMSFYKYGPVANAYPHKVDAIGSLMQRLRSYAETGNTEYLMDAANFAMIEYMHPRHPNAFFKATDDDGSPGRVALRTGSVDKRGNNDIGTGQHKSAIRDFL
jgi:hypothetical protein